VRQTVRITGAILVGAGALALTWAFVVWKWQDPITALYTTYQQHKLSESFDRKFAAYVPPAVPAVRHVQDARAEQRLIALDARRYRRTLRVGQPLGRLRVPRLGLSIIVVTGTDEASLQKGPGWYTGTRLPGEGQLIYIAGHRTTYLAPFAHIDSLRRGDSVTLELPYATFVYRITGHVIVPSDDLARLKSRGYEQVALQACHPRFFATHRYVAYARPVEVIPRHGVPYMISPTGRLTAQRS
jgi:LPXTG-site transpeptidase (sortase) family protein